MRYLYLLLLLVFSSCISKTETGPEPQKYFVMLPKAGPDSKPYSYQKKPTFYTPVLHIGSFPDTVDIDKAFGYDTMWQRSFDNKNDSMFVVRPYLKNTEWHVFYDNNIFTESITKTGKDSITIAVDTNQLSSLKNIVSYQYTDEPQSTDKIQCYPVIITNNGSDSLFFFQIRIFVEAQKENQNWQEINDQREIKCPVGEPIYWFAPGETIVTVVPKFEGPAKANFRVALNIGRQTFYSQVYSGTLNPELK